MNTPPAISVAEEDSMRYGISFVALLFALSVSLTPMSAQGRGKGQANKPVTGAKQSGPKADHGKPATAKGSTTAKSPKTATTAKNTKAPKAGKVTTTEARVNGNSKKAATTTASTTTTTGEVTPTTPTTTYVKNPKLEARLLKMLPGVTDIRTASQDFKNWGQFVAAVHASDRLAIPFETLKAKMTGVTPGVNGAPATTTTPMSLGQAVQSLKGTTTTTTPTTTSTTGTLSTTQIQTEVKKAEDAANTDLRRTRERS
jgi:hypothetical protein